MPYRPRPLDTSGIALSPAILELTEKLAKNAHEHWSAKRLADGWTLGPRNDAAKTNPCLIAYEELPDAEREYDRTLALETLKAITALGYRIEKAGQ